MIEERRAPIEAHLDSLKELRKAYLSHYRFLEGNAPEEYLSSILDDVHQLEVEIMEVRKQLPPPMSQRQMRAIEDIPEVWAEVTGKTIDKEGTSSNAVRNLLDDAVKREIDKAHEEALREALHRDLWARFDKPKEEAREEHGTPSWKVDKDSPAQKQRKSLVKAILDLLDTKFK